MSKRRGWLLILLAVLLVAGGLRVWGCFGQGYPFSFYPDEEGNVKRALRFGQARTLNPGWFSKPALGYYVLFAEYGAYYVAGRTTGHFGGVDDFAFHYLDNQGPFYLIGRISTSLFGLLTLLVVYRLGRRLQSRSLGLLSAVALAACAGHVSSGQQVKMDVPAAFWAALSVLCMMSVLRRGRLRDYLWTGFLAGLGTATKYYPAALIVPLGYAHLFRYRKAREAPLGGGHHRRFLAGGLALVVGFFVGSPYNFLDPTWFEHRLMPLIRFVLRRFGLWGSGQAVDVAHKTSLVDPSRTSVWDSLGYLSETFFSAECAGWCLGGLAVLGLLRLLLARTRRGGLLVVVMLVFVGMLAIANSQTTQVRHLVVVLPFAMILAAQAFLWIWGHASRLLPTWWGSPAGATTAFVILLALPIPGMPLRQVIETNLANARPDGRLQAIQWIQENVPPGSVILNDHEIMPLRANEARCDWVLSRIERLMQRKQLKNSQVHATLHPQWTQLRELARRGKRPTYDVLVMEHAWQTEKLLDRAGATARVSPLWMRSPWGGLMFKVLNPLKEVPEDPEGDLWDALLALVSEEHQRLAPVELWTRPTRVSKGWLTRDPEKRGTASYRPVEWFVTSREMFRTFDPRKNAHKRVNFPDYTRFYRDLADHYDCWELNANADDPVEVIWIFDLRKRVTDRAPEVRSVQ